MSPWIFDGPLKIPYIAMQGHVRIGNIMGQHGKEQGDLAVVENNNIAAVYFIGYENHVPDGLTQRFAPVREITVFGL